MSAICCLSETKEAVYDCDPPIEIGGYKYSVPNGTISSDVTAKPPFYIVENTNASL